MSEENTKSEAEIAENLLFWRKTLSDPEVKEYNINRFIAQIFAGVAELEDEDRAGALATVFSEVDTHDLIGKLWKGVGKLADGEGKTVCMETCKVCYQNWTDRDLILEKLGYDINEPSIGGAIGCHGRIENMAAEGPHATVFDTGAGTVTAITQSGQCVCYFHKIYGVIEPHHNHCYCTKGSLEGFYNNLLGKPVSIECDESYARGDNRCKFTIKLPESLV